MTEVMKVENNTVLCASQESGNVQVRSMGCKVPVATAWL